MKRSEIKRDTPLKRTQMVRTPRGFWTCRRQDKGEKCLHVNPNRKQLCEACGKRKPKKSKPRHMAVLDTMPYEYFVEINGEDRCGICGVPPKVTGRVKKLARDHEHSDHYDVARGLLCFQCNILLKREHTLPWMRLAVAYLERFEERRAA